MIKSHIKNFLLQAAACGCLLLCLSVPMRLSANEAAATNSASQPRAAVEPASANAPETISSNATPAPAETSEGSTNAVVSNAPADELGNMNFSATVSLVKEKDQTNKVDHLKLIQKLLADGRDMRRSKDFVGAEKALTFIMETNTPLEFKRNALFELALVAQDQDKLVKAQQIFAQYLHKFANDPSVPEVMLRQGIIFRQMGISELAVSKFYAVMSSALRLKLENIDYYKKLVLQAQLEIADTRYLDGRYDDAAELFGRMIRAGEVELNKPQVHYKLVRSLSFTTNTLNTVGKAQNFLELYPQSSDVPEVRFLLASALKKLGRNQDAMRQVLMLLQSQEENVRKNPETWSYWQQRAGNEIANQLYKEGDYLSALQIYQSLAELSPSPAWQLPVWYQCGMMLEQLQQPQQAMDQYARIVARQKELDPTNSTPGLQSLVDMAKWRKDYIDWLQKARVANQSLQPSLTNSVTVSNTQTAALSQ